MAPKCFGIISNVTETLISFGDRNRNWGIKYFMVIKPMPANIPIRRNCCQNSMVDNIFKPRISTRWA